MDFRLYRGSVITALIIVLVFVLFVYLLNERADLSGVWVAHPDFLASSELKSMILYINGGFINHSGYLYAENEEGIIEDKKISIRMLRAPFIDGYISTSADLWPDKMRLHVLNKNNIQLYCKDILYARLYRDSILSYV